MWEFWLTAQTTINLFFIFHNKFPDKESQNKYFICESQQTFHTRASQKKTLHERVTMNT